VLAVVDRPRGKSPLLVTLVLVVVVLVAVSGWLLTDPATTRADALRTGGLAAGSVVALYALWLNDRRRKVEERREQVERDRHELELLRAERERERVTDERFAKSVELLGHEADQVRVGALHALAGLARDRPGYTQTVLDVICAYLRRPFDNPHLNEDQPDRDGERELQVRLTAQRLIVDLLPAAGSDGPAFDLDLTNASLEYFDMSRRKVGTLLMRYAHLLSDTNLSGCEFTGPAWFTGATAGKGRLRGKFRCRQAVFHDRAWFSDSRFGSEAKFEETRFDGEVSFRNAVFSGAAILSDAVFHASLDLHTTRFEQFADLAFARLPEQVALYNTLVDPGRVEIPAIWAVETLPDGRSRLKDPNS
jgi:Pentapeptide repeats (9 copies)